MEYEEGECTVKTNGKSFTAQGAVVTPERITAYPVANGVLTDWHGKPLGTWRTISEWRRPNRSTMLQIEAVVDEVTYTGRSSGIGMIFNGKRKASCK